MAAISNPAPGSKYGPCAEPCEHADCKESREEAAALCTICDEPIGYEIAFYRDGGYGEPWRYKHFKCAFNNNHKGE